ncbi:MAG: DUF2807 domain-containing protein [Spirochaetaceae bacterium]|jgi:hypothetical protein|nr:DUF2807 domain-containing protein [Spirochaetaceae bacterium]
MKIHGLALMVSVSAFFMSCITIGNGNIITDERNLLPFQEITVSGGTEVRFHTSTEYRAVVTIDSNLNEYFETIVRNEALIIKHKPLRSYLFTKEIVDVYCPSIAGITISGSGRFEAIDKITTPVFKTDISGSGTIYGTIESNSFSARISGSGEINITGSSQGAEIKISGSGYFNGTELRINDCSIDISGNGKVNVFVEDNLNGKISGLGRIKYRGNPKIDFRNSGSGRIEGIE